MKKLSSFNFKNQVLLLGIIVISFCVPGRILGGNGDPIINLSNPLTKSGCANLGLPSKNEKLFLNENFPVIVFDGEKQSSLNCGDCNGSIHALDGAINRSTNGCCAYVTVNSSCALEYAWMQCDANGNGCVFVTAWQSWGGASNYCPSSAGNYAFCVRYPGCNDIAGETGAGYLCGGGGGGGGGGCTISASISPSSVTVCQGGQVTLNASASGASGYSYSWSHGLGTGSSKTITANGSATVSVTVTASAGCTAVAYSNINVVSRPNTPTSTTSAARCGIGSVTLTASGCPSGSTTEWWNLADTQLLGTGTSFNTPSISTTTTYVAWCKSGSCYSNGGRQATATINPVPNVSAGNDANICSGQQLVITANATNGTSPYTYNWSGGLGSGSSKTVAPVNTTTYTVTVSDANSCTKSDVMIVNVSAGPSIHVNVDKSEVCTGEPTIFSTIVTGGTGTTEYQWQYSDDGINFTDVNGALNATYTDNSAAINRWYRVIVDKGGCSVVSYPVKRTIIPTPNVTVNNATICSGANATINISNFNESNGCFDITGYESGVDRRATVSTSNSAILTTGPITSNINNSGNNLFVVNRLTTGTAYVDYIFSIPQQNFSNYQTLRVNLADGGGLRFEAILVDANQGNSSLGISANGGAGLHTFNLPTNTLLKDHVSQIIIRIQAGDVGAVGSSATMRIADIGMCGGSITWSPGGQTTASITVNPAATTTYTATVRYGDCQQVVSSTVTVGSFTASVSNDGPLTCSKTSVILTATPATGATYTWGAGATPIAGTNRATVTVGNATYAVTVTQTSSGCTAVASTTVNANTAVPTASISATGNNCITANAQLFGSATGGTAPYIYAYTGPNGFSATQQNPMITQNGTYRLVVTDNNGCTDDVDIIIYSQFNPVIVTVGTDICAGDAVTLTASGGGTYQWNAAANNATTNAVTVSPVITTSYVVTVTSPQGCVATATTTITVYSKPVISNVSTTPNNSCNNTANTGTLTITATGHAGQTLQYRINGGVWQTSNVFNNLGNGTYNAEVSYVQRQCISVPAAGTISSQSGLMVTAENDKSVCPNTNFTLSATANGGTSPYSYSWPGGRVGSPVTITRGISIATNYIVTVTDNKGCTATDVVAVSIHALPVASIAKDGDLTCIKTSAVLTASPGTGVTYFWSASNQTTRNITVNSPGSYTVTVTSTTTGCSSSTSTAVTQNITLPNVNAGTDKTLTCTNASVALNGSSSSTGVTYGWLASNGGNIVSGANTATPIVNAAGTYTLTVTTTATGCTSTDIAVVELNNTPPAGVDADNIGGPLTCIDNSATIRAFPNIATYTYAWSGPGGYTATSRENNVSVAGNYTVTVTNTQNGCFAIKTTAVLQDVAIPAANAGGDKSICNSTNTTLTSSGAGTGGSYRWSTNATTASIIVNPATTTTYTVTVTGANGCTASDQVVVTVTPLPSSGLTGPNEICVDEYAVFNASPVVSGATYAWTFDGGTSLDGDANDPTESIKWASTFQNTTRTVTLTVSKDNCSNTYTKAILVKTGVILNTQDNYPVCQGGTVQIGPNPNDANQVSPGATFQWTPNLFLNSNTVAQPLSTPPFDITYTLTATLNGCAVSRQITVDVNVNLNPVADAGQDKTVCLGNSVQIGGSPTATPPAGATISGVIWNVPPSGTITSTQQNPMVSPTTNTQYRVVVVASTGCTDTDFVNITVQPKAKIGNFVWRDDNANGMQDTTEPGLGSVPVKLYNTSNVEVAQTTSNAQGFYEFEVCAGTYYVEFGAVTGYSRTIANTSDDTKDSDANVTNGRTQNYTLNPGDNNPTVDAGYIPNGKIGDFVWEDRNGNGQQDVGEPGIANVTVQLLDQNNNVIQTTTTSSTGAYEFDNLPPGTYYVRVTPPTGYSVTTSNSGNDNTDSDINSTTNTTGAITLGAGQTNLTIDSGLLRSASLGDFVWDDSNGNGVQDAGEPGISGVTVSVEDAAGNPARDINGNIITSTTTGTNGQYQFTNLKPGVVYVVKFNTPSGYQPTSVDRGGDDTKDSDANTTTGKAPGVTLESGQNNPTIDAGYYRPASLGDFVWDDTNGNGRQDAGELGISGLTVTLTGTSGDGTPINQTTTTGTDGSYIFTGLKPGTYTVTFTKPTGTAYTGQDTGADDKDSDASPTTGSTTAITLVSGQNNTTIDAGVLRPASLGDYVFEDRNGNGVQDPSEPGISGVTVSVEDASGNPARDINGNIITATTTDTNGQYQFTNLKPGVVYIVKFTTPAGYQPSSADRGADDTKDSDANVTTGKAPGVTLTGGQNNPTIDAGYYRPATIGDFVWEDKNGNGVQDAGEPGIAGVTVTLTGTRGDGTPITPITVTTGTNGSYQFTNLAPGTYTVTFTKPTNTVTTTPDQGGDDSKDSDASITTGASSPVTVLSGETNNTIDAGYLKSASLGDFVWEDRNANGVQDSGEPGIAGVTVRLEDASGNQARDINNNLVPNATTGTNGQYQFTNLRPGVVYVVNFIAPNGYTTTSKDSGSDDTKDSDASITTGKSQQVTLSSGENNTTIDAGYYNRASIGDFVWEDLNANGVQDAGEPGIGGVTVRLFDSNGVQVAFTLTAANGSYSFINLTPGSYTVKFDTPNSYLPAPRDLGGNDTKDSDANPTNGLSPVVNLAGGDNNTTIDAGFYKLAQIGNFVWEDRNANGVQDAFEPGIAGVTVTLTGTDAFGAPVSRTTTTYGSGLYQFTNLVPGSYTVSFTKPGEIYKASPRDAGTDDARDSDANVTTGAASTVLLRSGDNNQTIDAGYYRCAYVGDYVWLDNNNNNLQDGNDIGLNGILVELYRVGNPVPVQTMLTINDPRSGREGRRGYYMFEVCDLGDYTIKVKPDMTIYQYVQPNQGLDDAIDSDIIDFINQSTLIFTVSYAAQITDIDAGVRLRPLPVTLKSFTGRWNTKKDVNELEWVTVSETNNDYFEVERSFRGSDFEVVAKVAGAGNSTKTLVYGIEDEDILVNGVYTYRLKQVDYDGKVTYHGPIEIKVERALEGGNIKVYPNPSRGAFNVEIEASEGQSIKADLYDSTGKLISSEMIDKVSQGELVRYQNNNMTLDKGMYYIVINIDGVITSKPLIIIE